MMFDINSIKKQWNKTSDSKWYESYRTDEQINRIIENPSSIFHTEVWALMNQYVNSFKDIKICVPSSGDNHAVFAFAALGAQVTSCDISERQLENAKIISQKHNWDINFVCDNTMLLENIKDDTFDFVYTSNGVHVWINDLASMYKNILRILKRDGLYIMFDLHPFSRPFSDSDPAEKSNLSIKIEKPYDVTNPSVNQYHWRIQDLLNAMIRSNLSIQQVEELYAEFGTYWYESTGGRENLSNSDLKDLYDWKMNPLAALPQWLCVVAKK